MKKTNIVLGIVLTVFVVCAASILIMAILNNVEKEEIPVNVDFEALSASIEETTNVDRTKMRNITNTEELQEEFGIKPEWVTKVIGVEPYVNITSSMYVIVEATDGNVDSIINSFEAYGLKYDEIWKDYLAEEYEKVQNRQIGSKGKYVYFIVSDYAKEIVDLIKD